jgi:transcriptional regulator GlxA family with amidase domain
MMNDPNGYAERIQRAVDRLAEHSDEVLNFAALARAACLSPYHFHRGPGF